MNLADYEYPEEPYPPQPRGSQAAWAQHRRRGIPTNGGATRDTEPITPIRASARSYLLFGIGIAILLALMVGAAAWQLSRLPATRPLQLTPAATTTTTEPERTQGSTGVLHTPTSTPTPDPRYDRQLSAGALGGFGKQPRDLDVGGRRFRVISCEGWDCQIELDDGAQVWVAVDRIGEPTPVLPPPPRPTVRVPVMVCADASGINGSAHLCALDGNYDALLAQAQVQAGPPIGLPPTLDPAVLAQKTQSALNDDATAYALQTSQAIPPPTPVTIQQVR